MHLKAVHKHLYMMTLQAMLRQLTMHNNQCCDKLSTSYSGGQRHTLIAEAAVFPAGRKTLCSSSRSCAVNHINDCKMLCIASKLSSTHPRYYKEFICLQAMGFRHLVV
jgi:hypothetical protein